MWIKIIDWESRLRSIIVSTIAMYVLIHLLVLALMPVALMVVVFGDEYTFNRFKKFFADAVFNIIGKKVRIVGLEKIRQDNRYLVISNYASGFVTFALMQHLPSITFVAGDFLTRLPLIGIFLKQIGAIFVDQKNPWKSKSAIDERLTNRGGKIKYLLIYPEGRRTVDGQVGRFKYGFIYILRHSNFDLLPVTANGFFQLKPIKRLYLDPSADLEIIIHDPIRHAEIEKMNRREITARLEELIKRSYRP